MGKMLAAANIEAALAKLEEGAAFFRLICGSGSSLFV